MPIPSYKFEDAKAGFPPRPVPVRFACRAANWTPSLFAVLVTGDSELGPPLIRVWEYNENTEHVGEVHSESYNGIIPDGDLTRCDELAALPPNHFVWSDELVIAFSDLIDLTSDRDSAHEEGLGIRWQPALLDCAGVVSKCTDLSPLDSQYSEINRIRRVGDAWAITFRGVEAPVKHTVGLIYISHLLVRPDREFSVTDLNIVANPAPVTGEQDPDTTEPEQIDPEDEESSNIEDGDNLEPSADEAALRAHYGTYMTETNDLGDAGDAIDPETIARLKLALKTLDERISTARGKGQAELVITLENQKKQAHRYLRAGTNKRGAPRIDNSDTEKMRQRIRIAIQRAIKDVKAAHPDLGRHLLQSIHKGFTCSYRPPSPTKWTSQ